MREAWNKLVWLWKLSLATLALKLVTLLIPNDKILLEALALFVDTIDKRIDEFTEQ